ncbi:MAG: DNA topoisomerase I [Candidatus Thorarchaeota archaeon]|nr:MAG: DNA topoisomerase I [Candidatus Thorarchaeota archaeon]RLI60243.1 MAG: DNA topoisomerase I [Candidatus Thorarchaeota archaeon]
MVIAEKPSAAKKIAQALDEKHSPKEVKRGKNRYYECHRNDDDLLVVYALGHLYELKQTEKGWTYPRLETQWVPKYEVDKKATNVKSIINLIKRLAKDVDVFVVATDYDIEGSLIGYLTLRYACRVETTDARRMKFSSLTNSELISAYDNGGWLNFQMIEAGLVRHEVDWLYGINLTRALTLSIKNTEGWFKIVSTGRVQGPTLSFVIERDRDINLFVPIPYWSIQISGTHVKSGTELDIEYEKEKIETRARAIAVRQDLDNQTAFVKSIDKRTTTQPPHPSFSLSSLQYESYRHFGYKPSRTLAAAQKLYLDALISYPRTSSEQLPDSIDLKAILRGLGESRTYGKTAKEILKTGRLVPVQGKKTDPAHPAIHPTGEKPERRLTPTEKKVYDLIVKRFLASFGSPARRESIRGNLTCGEHHLFVRGVRITEPGWMTIYSPYARIEERILPDMKEGDSVVLTSVDAIEKASKPPARFNPSSILRLLEKEDLGTKSTRSRIVDSLKSRGYVLNDKFEISTLGYALYETLSEFVPEVLSSDFTRDLEKQMKLIQEGAVKREDVLEEAKRRLNDILVEFKKKETQIGEQLVSGLRRYWKAKEEIGPCPKCEDGTLFIIRSPKTGKRFIGCSNYREGKCDLTFPLPQKGSITPLNETCPHCGHRMIKIFSGRRSWKTCINWAQCPGRADDVKTWSRKQSDREENR